MNYNNFFHRAFATHLVDNTSLIEYKKACLTNGYNLEDIDFIDSLMKYRSGKMGSMPEEYTPQYYEERYENVMNKLKTLH